MASSEVGRWQCERSLPQCMEYMLDNKLLCDVTFLVGEGRDKVHAHKLILASRSPVFYAMLEGPLAEKGIIEIPDIDKETFLILLRFMYTDDISFEARNVLSVMYAAEKYCVELLTKSCSDFLVNRINPDNVCTILDAALHLSEESVTQRCLDEIARNTIDCIKSEAFVELGKEALLVILKLEDLSILEEELYEQVMRWGDMECVRQGMEISLKNKRLVLGDAFHEIRFPVMDPEYFAEKVSNTTLLTSEEKVGIFTYYTLRKEVQSSAFKTTKRQRKVKKVERVIRFERHYDSWGLSGKTDAIRFQTSHDAFLHGIVVYGCSEWSCEYTANVVVKDADGRELVTYSGLIHSDPLDPVVMIDVMFEKECKIQAHNNYTVEMKMIGPNSWRGESGRKTVAYGNFEMVTFSDSPSCDNGTDEYRGQIPGLLLSS